MVLSEKRLQKDPTKPSEPRFHRHPQLESEAYGPMTASTQTEALWCEEPELRDRDCAEEPTGT